MDLVEHSSMFATYIKSALYILDCRCADRAPVVTSRNMRQRQRVVCKLGSCRVCDALLYLNRSTNRYRVRKIFQPS